MAKLACTSAFDWFSAGSSRKHFNVRLVLGNESLRHATGVFSCSRISVSKRYEQRLVGDEPYSALHFLFNFVSASWIFLVFRPSGNRYVPK
jgi:hypothetical protein